jgi:predicted GH43/DUF377 family glycosyl hydrolase
MSVLRWPQNPIITPGDVKPSRDDFEVIGTFNAAATRFNEQVILLLRVAERPISTHPDIIYAPIYDVEKKQIVLKEFSKDDSANDFSDPRLIIRANETYLTSISQLRVARSSDGVNFEIEDTPGLAAQTEYETFGLEDARISLIDGTYYINYVAVSPAGVATALASTNDFVNFHRHGIIFCPDNKDVVIFPEKVNGKFYAIHRPASGLFQKNDMWFAESNDLICWGNHRYLMGPSTKGWDCDKIGAGAVPVRIEAGWLEIYHGVDNNQRYCLGAVLLDADKPWKVLARSTEPIFEPAEDYECSGFFGNVVFTCGLLCEQDKLKIYYGAADTSICYTQLDLQDVLVSLDI